MKQNLKIKIFWITMMAIMLSTFSAIAQYPAAAPGKDGIFILFDRKLPIGFSYKLERKSVEDKAAWQIIHTVSMPKLSKSEIYNQLLSVNSKMPFYPIPDSVTIQKFINLVKGKKSTDSIYVYNAYPPYLEVLGTGYFDNSIPANKKYEYRVSKIDKSGKEFESAVVKAISYPGEKKNFKATSKEVIPSGNKISIRYSVTGNSKPTGFKVYRQNYLQTPFRQIHPLTSYSSGKEGITMLMTDTLVIPKMIYNYVVVPFDVLGNEGYVSDTVMVNNVSVYGEVPAVKDLQAISLDKELAIKLRWKTTLVQNLRSISIFRSLSFDDGYTLYTNVLPTDTVFIDRNVEPITNYFYYLVFNGAYGDSPESAKIIGMVKGLRQATLPPQRVNVKLTPAGNTITWRGIGTDTKGYYVFRGEGYSNPSEQISELIPSDSAMASFTDPIQNLKEGQPYCYAVKSVNTSNMLSPISETVVAEALKPQLPTPLNLEVRFFDGNALLIWEDMKSISSFVTGYKVWRVENGSKKAEKIQLTKDYSLPVNRFVDTTLQKGSTYTYFIQSEGIMNSVSSQSSPYEFKMPGELPIPPAGLRATKTNEGVILNWDLPAVEGLSGFKIYREKLGTDKKLISTVGSDISGFTDQNKAPGTYFYTITTTTNNQKESAPSDEVGVTIE
jgi:hypothetical protein